jgi:hypothetical protein
MFPMADNKLLIATIDKGLFLYDNKKTASMGKRNQFIN